MLIENRFSTEDVIKGTGGMLVNGDMGIPFKGISTDTRILEPGYLFWALKGKNYDGHSFWKVALEKGAKGLVLSYFPKDLKIEELPKTISIILVKDTLKALGDFATWYRIKKDFKVIAITGSCGKTTTKEITCEILKRFYRVAKNEANFNNLIGVPLSILSIKESPDWVVLELGTNQKGEIRRLAEIAKPYISLITCIQPAHLEGLSSIEGVLEEKCSLFEKTDSEGVLIYYYDQDILRKRAEKFPQRKISFGEKEGSDLRLLSAEKRNSLWEIKFSFKNKEYAFEVNLPGRHNLFNLLSALAVAYETGLDIKEVVEKLPKDLSSLVRGKIFKKGNWIILDDTYNANPGSMKASLLWLNDQASAEALKIAILGDMKELGEMAPQLHREIGEFAGEVVDKAIFIGEMALNYAEGFKNSGKPFEVYASVEDFLEKGSLEDTSAFILVKGSRALRMERIVKKLLGEEN
ncbi:MAG: UDP-N-acetylmuramoyl-tripeptide--D-alanyl-D-alanine ligase [Caldimicrobium sp.]